MTSNLGARLISSQSGIGFSERSEKEVMSYQEIKQKVTEEVKKVFTPEFLNRVDEIIVFRPLNQKEIEAIVDLMMKETQKRMKEHNMEIDLTPEARFLIAQEGYDPNFGARPLRRAIQKLIEDPLSDLMLKGVFKEGDRILVGVEGGKINFTKLLPLELSLKS